MSNIAVILISCDSFSDVWAPAWECVRRYWPDCPWPIFTMSNRLTWGERPVIVGDDQGWRNNLKIALEKIGADFVLAALDDMILCRPVDTPAVISASLAIKCGNVGAIRLGQGAELVDESPRGGRLVEAYRLITLDSPYRISTSPTLWRVSYLRKVLENVGPTAWEFEVQGTEFSKTLPEEIWVQSGKGDTNRAFRCYYTAITRGKWNQGCLDWLRQIGVEVGELKRGIN